MVSMNENPGPMRTARMFLPAYRNSLRLRFLLFCQLDTVCPRLASKRVDIHFRLLIPLRMGGQRDR
jgi:hypothetical protein